MGLNMVPKRIFLTKGVGKHKERLTSFELALRDAGIAAQNLVRVSSIFPPHCKLISRKEGVKYLYRPNDLLLINSRAVTAPNEFSRRTEVAIYTRPIYKGQAITSTRMEF